MKTVKRRQLLVIIFKWVSNEIVWKWTKEKIDKFRLIPIQITTLILLAQLKLSGKAIFNCTSQCYYYFRYIYRFFKKILF